jgi:tetratricopeptide (TPR) repeat protein
LQQSGSASEDALAFPADLSLSIGPDMAKDDERKADDDELSPAKRKRLQQCFEYANMQMRQESYDYAVKLYTDCVLGDPSNGSYAQSFLACLKQKYKNNKKGAALAFLSTLPTKGMVKKAAMQKDWKAILRHGVDVLKRNPWELDTLVQMANACEQLSSPEPQLHYLKLAQECDPNDPKINRLCAIALQKRGMYDQAIACWHRVEKARPGDEEAARAISSLAVEKTITQSQMPGVRSGDRRGGAAAGDDGADLTPEQRLERDIRRNPKDLPKYFELADLYVREELFDRATDVYKRAMKICKNESETTDVQERLEDVEMRSLRSNLQQAEKQAEQSGREQDRARHAQLKREFFQHDLELVKKRVERYPNSLRFKFELGQRYQLAQQYTEAITQFQLAKNDPKFKGHCNLSLGQCFQKIDQFRLAIDHYELAIQEIADRDLESKKKALYLAGKLSVYADDLEAGERHLTALAALDFHYKDVSALLDKITRIRENKGKEGGTSPAEE